MTFCVPCRQGVRKVNNVNDLYTPVELHPDLAVFVSNEGLPVLKHPLVFSVPYIPQLNNLLNLQLKQKKEAIKKSLENKNFSTYIWMHERPYRLQAFLNIQSMMDEKDYSKLLKDIWTDSENIWQEMNAWLKAFKYKCFNINHFMSAKDIKFFDSLPDQINIYRGCSSKNKNGLSWTLDHKKAVWFASRFGGDIILEKTVNKKDVLAYLSCRNEAEIILKKRPK